MTILVEDFEVFLKTESQILTHELTAYQNGLTMELLDIPLSGGERFQIRAAVIDWGRADDSNGDYERPGLMLMIAGVLQMRDIIIWFVSTQAEKAAGPVNWLMKQQQRGANTDWHHSQKS